MAASQIPTPSAPLTEPTSGRVTVPWFQFFQRLHGVVSPAVGGVAPGDGGYVVSGADPDLPNGRVATSSATVTVDLTVPGVITWHAVASGGDEWSVLTNGDVVNPELIFADGDVIMLNW